MCAKWSAAIKFVEYLSGGQSKSLKNKAIKASKQSEANRKTSKKQCMKSILDYANRLVDEAKVAQERSAKMISFANEVNKNL